MAIERDVVITLKLKSDTAAAGQFRKEIQSAYGAAAKASAQADKGTDAVSKRISKMEKDATKLEKDLDRIRINREKKEAAAAQAEERQLQRVFANRMKLLDRIEKERQQKLKQQERDDAAAAKSWEKQQKDAEKSATQSMKAIEKAQRDREAATARADATHQQATGKLQAANQKVITSTREAGEGFLRMARGLAILGISGEENLAIFAKHFVMIQAGFDVFSGGLKVILSVKDAYVALASAQKAAAIAGAAAAAAGLGGGAAGGAARAGGSMLGNFGAGAAGAGAATWGGRLAGMASGAGAGLKAAATGTLGLAGAGYAIGSSVNQVTGRMGMPNIGNAIWKDRGGSSNSERFDVAFISMIKAKFFDLAKSADAVKAAEQKRLVVIEAVRQAELQMVNLRGQTQAGLESIASRRDRALGLSDGEASGRARGRLASALEREEAAMANARRDNPDAILAHQQNILSIKEQIAQVDESAAESAKRTKEELTQQLDRANQLLQASRERIRAEEAGAKSNLAKFGELDITQQQSLRKISEKLQSGGKLNQPEADILKNSGLGGRFAEDFYADKGRAAGGENVLRGLGEMDALEAARRDEAEKVAEVARLRVEEQQAIERHTETTNRLVESLGRLEAVFQELARLQEQQINRQRDQTINPVQATAGALQGGARQTGIQQVWE